jgi:hypothetical protein
MGIEQGNAAAQRGTDALPPSKASTDNNGEKALLFRVATARVCRTARRTKARSPDWAWRWPSAAKCISACGASGRHEFITCSYVMKQPVNRSEIADVDERNSRDYRVKQSFQRVHLRVAVMTFNEGTLSELAVVCRERSTTTEKTVNVQVKKQKPRLKNSP